MGSAFQQDFAELRDEAEKVLIGKREVVEQSLICLLAGGHLLIEDVPGTGKTSLARALAKIVGGEFRRIQFTPDLLPSDVVGSRIFNDQTREWEPHLGPIRTNVLLADEINRASPKTQSALLEVMEERQFTIEGERFEPLNPFMVLATQNPVERKGGTYPLPEAQLDRFLMKVEIGYPDPGAELDVIRSGGSATTLASVNEVLATGRIEEMIAEASRVEVSDDVGKYVLRLANATRPGVHTDDGSSDRGRSDGSATAIQMGVSPRAVLALIGAAKASAASTGRGFVEPEDVKELVVPVWAHRLSLTAEAESDGRRASDVLNDLIDTVSVRSRR